MRITFTDAQRNVSEIANRATYSKDVLFELLAAYGRSTSAITKLRSGSLNLAKDKQNEVFQRGVVYFKHTPHGNLHSIIDSLDKDPMVVRYNPRYLIATDYHQLVAKDMKKGTTLDIKLRDIDRNVDFFYGWTGDEITSEKTEAIADRRAADKMKDLYAEIERVNLEKLANPNNTFRHDLNVFFSRLLFCFFAEDTKVFSKEESAMFTSSVKDFTQIDGSDLDVFLNTLFDALDTKDKSDFTSPYSKFPYVNGTIFDTKKHNIAIPQFNAQARKLMLDCGNLDWSAINPDIFGSMFQSIVDEEHRAANGMHYTSVPNIMKTIEPLFIDELREEFDKQYDDPNKLNKLWDRVSRIKVFDPACGSGNFLIIAYKELRKIEHGIIDRLFSDDYKRAMLSGRLESRIKLDNFYGIEIDDFAHEIAILSLYLAKHQMNIEFEEHFGKEIVLIPLKDNAKIVHGNAARLDWNEVCPNKPENLGIEKINEQSALLEFDDMQPELVLEETRWDEIYLISNPPYLGQRNQKQVHRDDMAHVFNEADGKYKKLDYVACWFIKGGQYIKGTRAKLAFISTDSICQGVQVGQLWPRVFSYDVEIIYAYTSFKWVNNAKDNAGVSVAVIGIGDLASDKKRIKYLFTDGTKRIVNAIKPYLSDVETTILKKHNEPISLLPKMVGGNQPREGGYLMLTDEEKNELIALNDRIESYIKPMVGANELIKDIRRWCIWIEDNRLDAALEIPELKNRVDSV
ncbi:class I SAM-dependent DNA methyltransferase, partial [Microbacteriaceae bacterium]|nr:class I SAM-dependent DNA methyltransferase [Candidatus Saccharibacteria bacterium]